MSLPIYFAPLQGYTDAIYREAHSLLFGGIAAYYAPFTRIERGEIRRKDIRDIEPENNINITLIPQLIAPTTEKMEQIISLFIDKKYRKVNINLGCPSPMLAKRHNGSGMLPYPDEVEKLLTSAIEQHTDLEFSVKMRLGWENPEECLALLPLLNELPLTHIILHPRIGKQQYKGEVDLRSFEPFYKECRHSLFYNGDIQNGEDIQKVAERFPNLKGIVIGRGLLANPAMAMEYQQGSPLPAGIMREKLESLHTMIFAHYESKLEGGELQLLTKMKTFWEYLLPEADRKARKGIHKATKLATYRQAVSHFLNGDWDHTSPSKFSF